MMVSCVCCGFDGHVFDYQAWTKYGGKYPDLYICDICYVEMLV